MLCLLLTCRLCGLRADFKRARVNQGTHRSGFQFYLDCVCVYVPQYFPKFAAVFVGRIDHNHSTSLVCLLIITLSNHTLKMLRVIDVQVVFIIG